MSEPSTRFEKTYVGAGAPLGDPRAWVGVTDTSLCDWGSQWTPGRRAYTREAALRGGTRRGGGASGPTTAGTLSPALRGGARVWGVPLFWHWPGVMPPLLEGGSLGLAPSGAGLPGTLVQHPAGSGPFHLSYPDASLA